MTVTVTDTRTTYSDAESLTGWTGGTVAGATVFAEATNSIIHTLNIATGQIYFTGAAIDLSNTLVYVWSDNFALQGLWDAAAPPNALHLGDGTDRISFKMAGVNRKVFCHLDAGTGVTTDWNCLVLDGAEAANMNTAGLTVVRAGSFAGLNLAAITQVGVDFTTLSKGLGGGVNVAVDVIRYGNDGLRITAGTTGNRGRFSEIVAEDQSSADGRALGIIRTLSTGLYSAQGPLNFGTSAAATDCFFEDTSRVLIFEDRNIADDKYYIAVTGHASATNLFILSNCTITTAGPFVTCNFNGGNVNTLTLTANSFNGLGNAITFSNAADASGHTVTGNTFNGCGQIDPGDVTFEDNTISSSTNANGSVLLDADGTGNWDALNFISDGTGHAILITATGTYDFTDFTYTGFAGTDGSTGNEVVYNNSGGAVTINKVGGDTPTVRNGTNASTTIVDAVTLTLTGIRTNSEVRLINLEDTTNYSKEIAGTEAIVGELQSATIISGGTGYTVSDTLTIVGGTGSAATLTVLAVNSGVITSVSVATPGAYTLDPTNPASVTGGTGTGATFNLNISGEFEYAYNSTFTPLVAIIVFHLNFREVRLEQELSDTSQSIPIQQSVDRVYSNP